jgi:hypothetical protein
MAPIFANFHVLFLTLLTEMCREALLHRIRALNDMRMEAFTVDGVYYGAPESVRRLIDDAIWAFEDDDFALCEHICDRVALEIASPPHGGLAG